MDKKQSRREFIELGLKAGTTLSIIPPLLSGCTAQSEDKEKTLGEKSDKLNILILGGTSFLGPHQIASAIKRGHSITTFTRGKTKPTIHRELFEQVEQLVGDREDNLTALENRKWDVVIDNSGRKVDWTKKSAKLLKENCDLYLYTSSTGVYYPYTKDDYKEDDEVLLAMPDQVDDDTKMIYDYGIMKANSELAAIAEFGSDTTIVVRPTYMIGPADKTDRFIYWPVRLSKGGEVMVPGKETDMVQYVDVRDVAEWMIRLIEDKKSGTYNAVGPKEQQNVYSFVEEASQAFDVESSFVKIDDHDFLKENGIEYIIPWIMPTSDHLGSAKISNSKAIDNGLKFRPLKETMKDTHDWWNSSMVSQDRRDKVEQNPDSILGREQSILEKWKSL
ncbi:MAG: NAD-dependent epimerase/dehydratase family protein [Bacteroidota bacterium]